MKKLCAKQNCEIKNACEELQKLGYKDSSDWMAILLFARNIVKSLSIISVNRKKQLQKVILNKIAKKDSSKNNYHQIIQEIETTMTDNEVTSSWKSELTSYRNYSELLAKKVANFINEAISTENGKDQIISNFGKEALEVLGYNGESVESIAKISQLISNMLKHYKEEANKWEKKAKQLDKIVNVDPLLPTIHNRRALDQYIQKSIENFKLDNKPFSLLMIDVDDFKINVNDIYGHQIGDDILRALAKILSVYASNYNFFAARYGGDELVLIGNLNIEEALHHADAIRFAIQNYDFRTRIRDKLTKDAVRFTVSVGVAEYRGNWTAEDLLNAADKAMYHVKSEGKNNVSQFSDINIVKSQ